MSTSAPVRGLARAVVHAAVRSPSITARGALCALALGGLLATVASAQTAPAATQLPVDDQFVQRATHACAACHGPEGRSTDRLAPSLAGQTRDYLVRQLKDFRSQSRSETDLQAYMWGISALLNDAQIEALADYYAQQKPAAPHSRHPGLERQGRQLFTQGIPARNVRACASCHGDKAEGQAGFPRLAGLHADYVVRQLNAFRTPLRPHGVVMKGETRSLTPAEMRALAAYVHSL